MIGSKMPLKAYRVTRILLILISVITILVYAYISSGGVILCPAGWECFFFIVPVISPVAMVICFFSMRWAAVSMWLLFLSLQSYYFWINWPSIYGMVMTLSFDWPLLSIALFLTVLAMSDKGKSKVAPIVNPA